MTATRVWSAPVVVLLLAVVVALSSGARTPVIIDTDIGTDVDDTWALSFLLMRPDVDIQLVLTATHNTPARTKLAAKFLTEVGRADVPLGLGLQQDSLTGPGTTAAAAVVSE